MRDSLRKIVNLVGDFSSFFVFFSDSFYLLYLK